MKAAAALARLMLCFALVAGNAVAPAVAETYSPELKQKAEQGDAEAQYKLALAYFSGNRIEQDKAEAMKWLRLAAEQRFVDAQRAMGYVHKNGEGVEQDVAEAVKWYRLASDQGDLRSSYVLGNMYFNGEGVEQDVAEAVKWYRLASNQGNRFASYVLGNIYFNGEGVEQDMAEVRKWYLLAHEQGHWAAHEKMLEIGDAYYKGKGVLPNYKEAAKWYRLAAERGDAEAQYRLGLMYAEGKRGIEQNNVEAYIWLALAGVNNTGKIGEQAASLREKVEENLTAEQFEQAQAEAAERLEKIKAKQ